MSSAKSKAEVIAALQADAWADRLAVNAYLVFIATCVFVAAPVGFAWVLAGDAGLPFWPTLAVFVLMIDVPCAYLVYRVRRSIRLNEIPLAELDDPVFGPIKLRRNPAWWEGEVRFEPVGQDLAVHISAGPEGPSEAQRELYRQIEARYLELLPKMHALLAAEAASLIEVHQDTTTASDYEFEPAGIEIEATLDKWIAEFSANALGKRGEELSEQSWGVDAVTNMSYFVFVENWEPNGVCLVD